MVNNKKTNTVMVLLFLFLNTIILGDEPSLLLKGESRFKNIRQLTFSGENAEAYFSLDGSQLVFQAHEGDSLCDQIYTMSLLTGDVKMVSTGKGVTTCAYFEYPDCNNIIYA